MNLTARGAFYFHFLLVVPAATVNLSSADSSSSTFFIWRNATGLKALMRGWFPTGAQNGFVPKQSWRLLLLLFWGELSLFFVFYSRKKHI